MTNNNCIRLSKLTSRLRAALQRAGPTQRKIGLGLTRPPIIIQPTKHGRKVVSIWQATPDYFFCTPATTAALNCHICSVPPRPLLAAPLLLHILFPSRAPTQQLWHAGNFTYNVHTINNDDACPPDRGPILEEKQPQLTVSPTPALQQQLPPTSCFAGEVLQVHTRVTWAGARACSAASAAPHSRTTTSRTAAPAS